MGLETIRNWYILIDAGCGWLWLKKTKLPGLMRYIEVAVGMIIRGSP